MLAKPASTSQPIHELLASRWSPRAFDSQAPISRAQIVALAEAARWAPSCFGAQPWVFVFCDRSTDPQAWEKALGCLVPGNQAWAKNCPLLIAAAARSNYEHNGSENAHHRYDTGAAAFSLVLQAEALGLRSHQMGGFDQTKAAQEFSLPEGVTVIAMIAVGRQADPETLPEGDMRKRETAARSRKDLNAVCVAGKWGKELQPPDQGQS